MIPRSKSNLSQFHDKVKDIALEDVELVKLDLSKKNIHEFPMNNQLVKNLNVSSNRIRELNEQMMKALLSLQRLTILDLSNNFLTVFPNELKNLNLEELNLFKNNLQNNENINSILSLPKLKKLDISQNKFKSLPKTFPPNLEILNADFNLIPKLENILIPNLTRLSLVLTQLENISPDITFPNLKHLDLSRNNLASLPDLKNLCPIIETLNLSDNFLPEMPIPPNTIREYVIKSNYILELPGDMKTWIKLQSLDISHNFIEFIPALPPSLISLVFSSNRVKVTTPCKLPKLQRLYLRENQLTTYPQYDKIQIREYSAGFNLITVVKPLPYYEAITRIDFTDNQITEIPSFVFKLINLSIFVFSKNKIRTISTDIIKFKNLKILNLTENPIEILPPLPKSLTDCYVGYCNLKALPDMSQNVNLVTFDASGNNLDSYPNAPHLKTLILSRNRILSLPNLQFIETYFGEIEALDLSFNFIRQIPSSLNIRNLEELDLSFNSIKIFPDNFILPKLQYLKLGSNPISLAPNKRFRTSNEMPARMPLRSNSSNVIEADSPAPAQSEMPTSSISLGNIAAQALSSSSSTSLISPNAPPSLPKVSPQSASQASKLISPVGRRTSIQKVSLDADKFGNLQICDITNTGIVFDKEPKIRQLFVSRRLPQYKTLHVKVLSCLPWVAYSEMKGVRKTMEDSLSLNALINGDVDLFVICDGHSGYQTSAFSCLYLVEYFSNPANLQKLSRMTAYNGVRRLNNALHSRCYPDGSTLAMALFNGRKLVTAHVGDARILLTNKEGKVSFETVDHKATDRSSFERVLLSGGRISQNRIQGILAPGRSLGDYNIVGNTDEPEVKSYIINPDKDLWLIIACDGVFDVLSNKRIAEIAKNSRSASELAFDLRNLAFSHMSLDNISVVVVDIKKRFQLEEQILANQCNLDLNDKTKVNNTNESAIKEDMLKKIRHVDDNDIFDSVPEHEIVSAFEQFDSNDRPISPRKRSKNQEFDIGTDMSSPTSSSSYRSRPKVISFSTTVSTLNSGTTMNSPTQLASILKNNNENKNKNNGEQTLKSSVFSMLKNDEDDDIDAMIRTPSTFCNISSSKSLPLILPEEKEIKANDEISIEKFPDFQVSNPLYRKIESSSDDDNDNDN